MNGACQSCGEHAVRFVSPAHLECSVCGALAKPFAAWRCAGCGEVFDHRACASTRGGGIRCHPCLKAFEATRGKKRVRETTPDTLLGSEVPT